MVITNTPQAYNNFLDYILKIYNLTLGQASPRMVVVQSDGTVVIDTARLDANIYANWKAKTINENQNTRIDLMVPQMFECGV